MHSAGSAVFEKIAEACGNSFHDIPPDELQD
jgi:hypothetical protein